jgi:hypothetical protein
MNNRPLVIADYVWDRGYVMIAYCPPLKPEECVIDCTTHWQKIHLHELQVHTTDNGYVVVRYPDGTTQELVRQGGATGYADRRRYWSPGSGAFVNGSDPWTR